MVSLRLRQLVKALHDRMNGRDAVIDGLIAQNAAKAVTGMEQADWARIEQIGRRRWQEVALANWRYRATRTRSVA